MSGGHFDYKQYDITFIIEELERVIKNNNKKIPRELWNYYCINKELIKIMPHEEFYSTYPDEIMEHFKKGLKLLKMAQIYTQRIDWFLSGDDGEESFLIRLREDLSKLNDKEEPEVNCC